MTRLDPAAWGTVGGFDPDNPLEGLKESHLKRARKRAVTPAATPRYWIVYGDPKLGDTYETYDVKWHRNGQFTCSCQEHAHGEYRQWCTHRTGVLLHREEHLDPAEWKLDPDTWIDEIEQAAAEEAEENLLTLRESAQQDQLRDSTPQPDPVRESAQTRFRRLDEFEEEPSPHHPGFGDPPLPDKFTEFRMYQWDAIREIAQHLHAGVKVVFVDAPTGAGKSLIGEVARRLIDPNGGQGVYMCSTKTLQGQVLGEFPYSATLMGRANYPTMVDGVFADSCTKEPVSGAQCVRCPEEFQPDLQWADGVEQKTFWHCFWCHPVRMCAYNVAKEVAAMSPLPVLNMAYWINETQAGDNSRFVGRRIAVVDEADVLHEELTRQIEYVSTPRNRKWLGITTLPKKTVADDWRRWLEEDVLPAIIQAESRARGTIREARARGGDVDPKTVRRWRGLVAQRQQVKMVVDSVGDEWVLTGYEGRSMNTAYLTFKPVRVGELARHWFWNRANQFVLMSATLISPELEAADLGLEQHEWAVVSIPSTFPPERRPIFFQPAADMKFATKDEEWPKMVAEIDRIVHENPGKRILVHAVSYALAQMIYDGSTSDRVITYRNSGERDAALEEFKSSPDAVMIAPSFERGVDLPHELCRLVIVAKVPWPPTNDKQVNRRMRTPSLGGQRWYVKETIRSLVQMTGRAMRSTDDWCEIIILDTQFRRLWRQWKVMFPKWWREAVVLNRDDPRHAGWGDPNRKEPND